MIIDSTSQTLSKNPTVRFSQCIGSRSKIYLKSISTIWARKILDSSRLSRHLKIGHKIYRTQRYLRLYESQIVTLIAIATWKAMISSKDSQEGG